jgi:hypothetical protein
MKTCLDKNVTISAIEDLISGGTRVVMMNGDDAAVIRRVYKSKLLSGPVVRTRWVRSF